MPAWARARPPARYVYCGSSMASASSAAPPPTPPPIRPSRSATSRPHSIAGHESHGEARRMAAEERPGPRRQEGEADARDDRRGGIAREPPREPVGGETGRGEREEDEQVVGGVEAEHREER